MADPSWDDSLPAVWNISRRDDEGARRLAAEAGVSELVARVLLNRGLSDAAEARAFLRPELTDLGDPLELPGLRAAATRLKDAVRARERILVYGDYDVDGISGTALLVQFLRLLGADAHPYLPNRLDEGYGLNEAAVRRFKEEGVGVLVTVDHGTTAVEEIRLAGELGIPVVVVDHHLPGDVLPAAHAIVNPHLGDDPGPHPCGVGVAFKLAWGLAVSMSGGPRVAEAHRSFLTDALALVALGTVADVVPLRGENRILTTFGLKLLSRTSRPGLRALLEVADLGSRTPTATDVAFRIAPRLNAAGRLGRAELSLELLTTDSPARGREIAELLDEENRRRKDIERGILADARERLERDYAPGHVGAFVLGDPEWHAGVVGIVAARIVDRYHRPAAVAAFDGGLGRGSCRTIPGISLPEALRPCDELLESWGGHHAAAGFTVREERFPEFRVAFDAAVRDLLAPEHLVRQLAIDAEAPISAFTPGLVGELARLQPFGAGNPEPVFAARGVRVAGAPRRMGKTGDHLSFLASDGSATCRAVGFSFGPLADKIARRGAVDIAFVPQMDEWRGDGSVELLLKDLAPAGDGDG